jgi:transposase-like protein
MKRRFHCTVEVKKELVGQVISGYRTEHVARLHNMAPKTLQRWVREYWDEVEAEIAKKKQQAEEQKQAMAEQQDWKKKYEQAVKLLGEKDVEIAILNDLAKKTNLIPMND